MYMKKKKKNPKRSKDKRKAKRNGLQGGYRAGRSENEHRDAPKKVHPDDYIPDHTFPSKPDLLPDSPHL